MTYTLRWPDASQTIAYSPSLVIQDYFAAGSSYPLPEFIAKLREATGIASERVRARYGFACSRASDQLEAIEAEARRFSLLPEARVDVLSFGPA